MSSAATTPGPISDDEPQEKAERLRQRRADIDAKQIYAANLLQQSGAEGLLILRPENFSWLASGATLAGLVDPAEAPALFFSTENRWLISSNADTQRLFDEELDGLGFQLKEWPWHWGRAQCLADLCEGRIVASDRPLRDHLNVSDRLSQARRCLSSFEQSRLRELGQIVSHALEATCRTMTPNLSEREVAGQLGHRLLHRGVAPYALSVGSDERPGFYRRFGFTGQPIRKYCLVTVTGAKHGLHATASRAVCFGQPDSQMRQDFDTVSKVCATYVQATRPSAAPRDIIHAGRRVYLLSGAEHEWLAAPQGHLTGRAAVEQMLRPNTEELLQCGWVITWQASAGAAASCDTFLLTEQGCECITPMEAWPVKRIRTQGEELVRPYLLVR